MAPSPVVKAPSTKEYLELIQGPRVDIYVGNEQEHFSVPKALLCYYSKYFDRCFNGSFQEAQTQKLEIPEEDCVYFKTLLAVMLQGKPETDLASELGNDWRLVNPYCRGFLQCADKYNLSFIAADIMYPILRKIWFQELECCDYGCISGEDVEVFFTTAPLSHPLRDLIVRCAVWSETGRSDGAWELRPTTRKFQKQQLELEGFAYQTLDFIISHNSRYVKFYTNNFKSELDC
ncbi:hypothetical protein HYFRA_00002818 [Hymenoscyphus fraxineus]|uniref:BTB domain-containing protein n=1 Tax=Hymenoscyphus fraxineus TaxID=746836 RepID=A0A9N9KMR1_9HELO|nr:hypothetical protein HYFRA_00002818 [Hymenoscyphus fraxineus]